MKSYSGSEYNGSEKEKIKELNKKLAERQANEAKQAQLSQQIDKHDDEIEVLRSKLAMQSSDLNIMSNEIEKCIQEQIKAP